MRISTRKGDNGESSLSDGKRLKKSAPVFHVLGNLDELNSFLGFAKVEAKGPKNKNLVRLIERLQADIYRIMSIIANDMKIIKNIKTIDEKDVRFLEQNIEKLEKKLGVLRKFIKPGKGEISVRLHIARAVCRRAERKMVGSALSIPTAFFKYINRLSDLLFLLAEERK